MINPGMIMKIKGLKDRFVENHPKFPLFLKAVYDKGLRENSIVEISITRPDGEKMVSNIKLNNSDIEMLNELQNIIGKK